MQKIERMDNATYERQRASDIATSLMFQRLYATYLCAML